MTRRPSLVLLVAFVLLPATAGAVDKCKVKLDAKNGNLLVSAASVTGALRFGASADAVSQSFFDAATCVAAGKAKECHVGDPATVAARTPPPGCTLYLADDQPPTCSVWIKGCTPGVRMLTPAPSCARVVDGITIFDACP